MDVVQDEFIDRPRGLRTSVRLTGRVALTTLAVSAGMLIAATPAGAAPDPEVSFNEAQRQISDIGNGLAWYALMMCLAGLLISSSLWAIGSKGQNPGQELTGKRGIIVCCTAAFFIGATPSFINWLEKEAPGVDRSGVTNRANVSQGFSSLSDPISPVKPAPNGLVPAGPAAGDSSSLLPGGSSTGGLAPAGGTAPTGGLAPAGGGTAPAGTSKSPASSGSSGGLGPAGSSSTGSAPAGNGGLAPAGGSSGGGTSANPSAGGLVPAG